MITYEEFIAKNKQRNLDYKYSDEVNKKKGSKGEEHPMWGKHHSQETKGKLRQTHLGKHHNVEVII